MSRPMDKGEKIEAPAPTPEQDRFLRGAVRSLSDALDEMDKVGGRGAAGAILLNLMALKILKWCHFDEAQSLLAAEEAYHAVRKMIETNIAQNERPDRLHS